MLSIQQIHLASQNPKIKINKQTHSTFKLFHFDEILQAAIQLTKDLDTQQHSNKQLLAQLVLQNPTHNFDISTSTDIKDLHNILTLSKKQQLKHTKNSNNIWCRIMYLLYEATPTEALTLPKKFEITNYKPIRPLTLNPSQEFMPCSLTLFNNLKKTKIANRITFVNNTLFITHDDHK